MKPRRQVLLEEAIQLTTTDRNKDYGNPEDNFRNIADYWNVYQRQRGCESTPQDVAMLMILVKVARLATNPTHFDSLVDIAGYAACAADCHQILI